MTRAQSIKSLFESLKVFVPVNHPLADVLSKVTYPTKRNTAEDHDIYFTDDKSFWRTFSPDIPQEVRQAIMKRFQR